MILLTEKLEIALKNRFQKHIQLIVRDKKIAEGKLLIYRVDSFYVVLTLQTDTGNDQIEIPYPFNVIESTNNLQLDYRLEALSEADFDLLFALQGISKRRDSKFYNTLITINIV